MTRRNVYHYLRLPALLAVAVTQSVLFVVMFTYVFGGAIHTPGVRYVDYLMPGILLLAVAFGSPNTGVGLAEDLTTGMLDRFRSLPMARPAPLAGRILADAIRNLVVVLVMIAVGSLIGFRFHAGPLAALAAIALPVAVGCVLSWFAALVGLATGDPESAGAAASCRSSRSPSPAPPSCRSTRCPAPSKPGRTSTRSPTSSTPTAPSSSAAPPPSRCSRPSPG